MFVLRTLRLYRGVLKTLDFWYMGEHTTSSAVDLVPSDATKKQAQLKTTMTLSNMLLFIMVWVLWLTSLTCSENVQTMH